MSSYERFVLPNGLRIIITPRQTSTKISTWLFVRGGSRTESKEKSGISHFMEHMFFKGGKKYPNPFQLKVALDRVGAVCNATTSKESVQFYVTHTSSCGLLGLDVLEDMIIHATFPEHEIELERGAVQEEFRLIFDDPSAVVSVCGPQNLLFGEHPLGYEISGTPETIAEFNITDLAKYRTNFFTANNIVLSVAGNISVTHFIQEVEKRFGAMRTGAVPEWLPFDRAFVPNKRTWLMPRKEKTTATIEILSLGPGYTHQDRLTCLLLTTILGGCWSSRVYQELREEKGLVYDVGVIPHMYAETGQIVGSIGTSHETIAESITRMLNAYKKIREQYISEEELERAKGFVTGFLDMAFEESEKAAEMYGIDEARFSQPTPLDERKKRILAITKHDILRVAQTYLAPSDIKIAMAAQEEYCNEHELETLLESAS